MELVEGQSLRQWLDERPRTSKEIVAAFIEAGKGLAAAHQANLVHRDFKPANVLVAKDGRILVTDFGLARSSDSGEHPPSAPPEEAIALERSDALATPLTEVGTLVGTPAYMAPEQLRGSTTDARTDQFAFCVSLYEALHGDRPFPQRDHRAREAAMRAGSLAPGAGREKVPGWIRKVLLRGLSFEPEQRYPSMDLLLEALARDPAVRRRRIAAVGIVAALSVTTLAGVRLYERMHSRRCRAEAASRVAEVWNGATREKWRAGFAATGKPFALKAVERAKRVLDRYAEKWVAASAQLCEERSSDDAQARGAREACLSIRLKEMRAVTELLSAPEPRQVTSAVRVAAGLSPAAECLNASYAATLMIRPEQLEAIGDLRADLARADGTHQGGNSRGALQLAIEVAKRAEALGNDALLADALALRADVEWHTDRREDAKRTFLDTIVVANRSPYGGSDLVRAQANLSTLYAFEFDEANALLWMRLAESTLARIDASPLLKAKVASLKGIFTAKTVADLQRSLEAARRVTSLRTEALGREHPRTIESLQGQVEALCEVSLYEEALALSDETVRLSASVLGTDTVDHQFMESYRSRLLWNVGRYEEALEVAQRSYQALQASEGRLGYYLLGVVSQDLPAALWKLGRRDEALATARDGLARSLEVKDESGEAMARYSIGLILLDANDPVGATPMLEKAVNGAGLFFAEKALAKLSLAKALVRTGKSRERATQLALEARDTFRELPGHAKDAIEVEAWLTRPQ
jgi:tetratricopeptide (TPR) repeat protein